MLLSRSAGKVRIVAFVLQTVMLEEIGVWQQFFDDTERDGPRENLRIGERNREVKVAVIAAAESLLDAHGFAVTRAARVQPAAIVEAGGVDHQRVAVPSAH